jgi:hypothetical protein
MRKSWLAAAIVLVDQSNQLLGAATRIRTVLGCS